MKLLHVVGDWLRRGAVAAAVSVACGVAGAAERVALVVGNGAYIDAPLENPVNDARLMTAALRDLGFQVILVENADRATMQQAARSFRAALAPNSLALAYFAGHALQYRGINYLLPVDFAATQPSQLDGHTLRADNLLVDMHAGSAGVALLVLDSCRNNPFGDAADALGPGLASIDHIVGETLVAYAAAAGEVAEDGSPGNSPFTSALVSALDQPGLDLYQILRNVRGAVREATDGRQLPWVSGSIERAIVLNTVVNAPDATVRADAAAIYWNTIARSRNPADLDAFLKMAAGTPEAAQARERRDELVRSGAPVTPTPVIRQSVVDAPPGGLLATQTPCDLVASSPADPRRVAAGIDHRAVNTRVSLRLCAEELAKDPDNPRLAFQLGRVLEIAGRNAEALALYKQASANGYAAATANLGSHYRTGHAGTVDLAKSAALYRLAAEQGSLAARNALGLMYRAGFGVPQSAEEGYLWTKLAADDGWPNAIDTLGTLQLRGEGTPTDPAAAFANFAKAAALGSHNAMNNVARMLRAARGVEADLEESVVWFERAIEAGNDYAPYELGRMYRKGWHVSRDPRRAIALFELAGERGFVEAYTEIAEMHEAGEVGRPDPAEAYYHFLLSREAGRSREGTFDHPQATTGLARLESALDEQAKAELQARVEAYLRLRGPIPSKVGI